MELDHAKLLRRIQGVARLSSPVRAVVRYLATDPGFVRAVAPESDAVKIDEQFVWPIVVQSLCVLRSGMAWPPEPVTAATIDGLTGVPSFAVALAHANLVATEGGMYDLIPLEPALPAVKS